MVLASLYVLWMVVVPPIWIGPAFRHVWRWPQLAIHRLVAAMYGTIGVDSPSLHLQAGGFYVVSAFLIPLITMFIIRPGPLSDLGWRRPNQLLLRIVACSFVISIPFLYWMVHSPGFAGYYKPYVQAGPARIVSYYIVVLFCEHSLLEGTLLGLFRRGHKWPEPPEIVQDATSGLRKNLQWVGLAQPTKGAVGVQRITRWAGLPDGCLGAVLLTGVLFGMIHWGKNGREFLLSFPGGVFLGYIAYRCNSWHAPYVLHASTVAAAGIMMMLAYYW